MATELAVKEKGYYQLSVSSDRPYTAVSHNEAQAAMYSNGILLGGQDLSTEFKCNPSSGTMNTTVSIGNAIVEGHVMKLETSGDITHTTADVTNPRYDLIVLEKNTDSGTREDTVKLVTGTPAASPSEPSLTQSGTVHQEKLYAVLIPANETDSDNFTYTDYRDDLISYASVNVSSATETTEGISRKATTAEAEAGTSDVGFMTPQKTKEAIDELVPATPFCESYYTGSSITSDGFVLWNNDRYDDDNMHDTTSNQQYFVAQNDGKYDIIGNLGIEVTSGTGSIIYRVEICNASNVLQREYKKYINMTTTGSWSADFEVKTYLSSGEKVAIRVTGVSGTAYVAGVEETTYITVSEVK